MPLASAPLSAVDLQTHTGRMLLAKRSFASHNDSNAHWIDEQAAFDDDDSHRASAKHFEAASRFERPASLAQVTPAPAALPFGHLFAHSFFATVAAARSIAMLRARRLTPAATTQQQQTIATTAASSSIDGAIDDTTHCRRLVVVVVEQRTTSGAFEIVAVGQADRLEHAIDVIGRRGRRG